ncbi:hypothetical protein G7054_g1341 [Neopestalotiopsis clavispora]|nr:hypothetical protein G7054_g1341 [Neopestalotiopsis clavispora]
MSNSIRIQDFQGMQYPRDGNDIEQRTWSFFNEQYASSTYQAERDLNPALIVQPRNDGDIIAAINWARENKRAIAVKSGGHQYSGASSTGKQNIQIDLTDTFKDMQVMPRSKDIPEDRAWIYVGVSNRLKDFNAWLAHVGLFVPHGQCAYVCVGGHGQTGGYGQLGRGFGLFGDHIVMIRMIDHAGKIQEITKKSDPELFWAILGGSPGNFGIITHYVLSVYRAESYKSSVGSKMLSHLGSKDPHGLKGLYMYNKDTLEKILQILAEFSDNPKTPRNFDLCVSVFSMGFDVKQLFPVLKKDNVLDKARALIRQRVAGDVLELLNGRFPAVIVVYASWCPLSSNDKYDETVNAWFDQFRKLEQGIDVLASEEFKMDMAKMTGQWIFPLTREFNLPYRKRTYTTNSTQLATSGWVQDVVKRLELIYNPNQRGDDKTHDERAIYNHCKLSVQIQAFGGANSQFAANKTNGTSYSWRDTTICQTLDCFHEDQFAEYAKKFQEGNDRVMIGPNSNFSKQDRRVLWGSYGDWDMSKPEIWKAYHEDEAKYQRLGKARGMADPNGTFTANPFSVTAINGGQRSSHL